MARTATVSTLEWVALGLATVTGLVHLALGVAALPDPLGVASLLAAAGFAGGAVLYAKGFRRQVVLALGVPFVAAQIVLWYLLNEPSSLGDISPMAAVDKPVQVVLIVVLVVLFSRTSGEQR